MKGERCGVTFNGVKKKLLLIMIRLCFLRTLIKHLLSKAIFVSKLNIFKELRLLSLLEP